MKVRDITERQKQVLYCIVSEYIRGHEPISSKKVLSSSNLTWSGATIRNDMNRLMKTGYIYQPHTSAGRVPTDKGLRFYVDELLKIKSNVKIKSTSVETVTKFPIGDLEKILTGAGKLLSSSTNSLVIIQKPSPLKLKIKRVVITSVTNTFSVINIVTTLGLGASIPIQHGPIEDFHSIENILNGALSNTNLSDFRENIKEVLSKSYNYNSVDKAFLELSEKIISETYENYIIEGLQNIVNFVKTNKIPEVLKVITSDNFSKRVFLLENGVYIGKEHGIAGLEDFSIVLASFLAENIDIGRIAVVFEKYQNYDSIIDNLIYIVNRLGEYFTIVSRNV